MNDRSKWFTLRLSEAERERLEALAKDEGEPASTLVRRWIRQRYEARFGDLAPPRVARR